MHAEFYREIYFITLLKGQCLSITIGLIVGIAMGIECRTVLNLVAISLTILGWDLPHSVAKI
jgi:hypothetical protein